MSDQILNPGEVLDGFRVEALIGAGATAVVYRAEQLSLGRPVALKVLSRELSGDGAFRERFRREGKHLARLEHPNIVPVHGAGERDGLLYLAMRMVEGTNLASLILAEKVDAEQTVAILGPIAAALDAAHAEGLVHRDVKPQNILITARGHPYLADFGVAKGSNTHSLTATGRFVGTVNYASPEQIAGAPLTAASDVYALTAVLYHCLTGEVPYVRESDEAIMQAHLHDPPPALPRGEGQDGGLSAAIACGMAKSPDVRYVHARDLLTAASRAVGRMSEARRRAIPAFPVRARRTARRAAASAGPTAAGLTAADRRRPEEPAVPLATAATRSRRRLIVGALGILLPVLVVAGYLALSVNSPNASTRRRATLDVSAAVSGLIPSRRRLSDLHTHDMRSLASVELGLAGADTQSASLLGAASPRKGDSATPHLIASLRAEAARMSALARDIRRHDASGYSRLLAGVPALEWDLMATLGSYRTLGSTLPALPAIAVHSLAPPPHRHPSRPHRRQGHAPASASTLASASAPSPAPATETPTVSSPAPSTSSPAPTGEQAAPAPSHAGRQEYGPTVIAPPQE